MKKRLICLLLCLCLTASVLLASCAKEEPAPIPAAPDPEGENEEAETEEEQDHALPIPFIDLAFTSGGEARDVMGTVTCEMTDESKGSVETGALTLGTGETVNVPHYRVRASGGVMKLHYAEDMTNAELLATLGGGFTMEAFLVNFNALSESSGEQCLVSSTQSGGYNMTTHQGKYKFSVHTDGDYRHGVLDAKYDNKRLTHLLGVYDPQEGIATLYVNGVKTSVSESAPGVMALASGTAWKTIVVGGDVSSNATEFHCTDMAIADFKIYPVPIVTEDVTAVYEKAVADLTGEELSYAVTYTEQYREGEALFPSLSASYADVYEPTTGIVFSPTVLQYASASAAEIAEESERPATVYCGVETRNYLLCATDPRTGESLGSLFEFVKSLNAKAIPAFGINDAAGAEALSEFIRENNVADCFIVSADETLLRDTCDTLYAVRPILDMTDVASPAADTVMLRASACGAKNVLLSAAALDDTFVLGLQARALNVIVALENADVAAIHNAVTVGSNGILTGDYRAVLDYYKSIDVRTLARKTLIVAHRGNPGSCPDNLLRSFVSAAQTGATSIELDIWLTTDNHLAINHDATTTNYATSLTCNKSTRAQLEALTYTGRSAQAGDKMAFLDEVFAYFSEHDTHIVLTIEIKDERNATIDRLAELMREYRMEGRVQIICMNHSIVRYAYERYHYAVQMNQTYLSDKNTALNEYYLPLLCAECAELHTASFLQWTRANSAFAMALRHRGIKYSPWTTSGDQDTNNHYSVGYLEFTTNNPAASNGFVRSLRVTMDGEGNITATRVNYDRTETDVTDSVRLMKLSGQVALSEGKVTGSGTFALYLETSLPLKDTYTYRVYSMALTK